MDDFAAGKPGKFPLECAPPLASVGSYSAGKMLT